MPPRKPAARPPPGSALSPNPTDLVRRGNRQVQVKHPNRLDENGLLPSTARALVLRNGKQGAMGTGELMSLRKPIGRDKLDLLGGKPLSNGTNNRRPSPLVEKRTFLHSRPRMLLLPRSMSNGSSTRRMQSTAVRFKFSVALVQDSEYYPAIAHIDSIRWLKDPDLFYHELSKEVRSNISQSSESTHQDPLKDRNTVLNVLGTRYGISLVCV